MNGQPLYTHSDDEVVAFSQEDDCIAQGDIDFGGNSKADESVPFSDSFTDPLTGGREVLAHIRKESVDIYNRLHSIEEDTKFVEDVAKNYASLPLLPNLRCGAWYTNPRISTSIPAYFKSTDGHFSNWSFNLRRPNLHLLSLIAERKGMVLVDSTRAGKKIPDALSKTVPIWCAVVNQAIKLRYPEATETRDWNTSLYTPPASVSRQEHSQISLRLSKWAQELYESSYTLPQLSRPLRPLWITPAMQSFPDITSMDYHPVICVSASMQVPDGMERRNGGFSYVQGSADDHEAWSLGLTPELFWEAHDQLMSSSQDTLPDLVVSLVAKSSARVARNVTAISKSSGRLFLCANSDIKPESGGAHLVITTNEHTFDDIPPPLLVLNTDAGKKGQHLFVSNVLPNSVAFIRSALAKGLSICVSCDSGNDISAGIVLVTLQLFFNDDGAYDDSERPANKRTLRTRLEWIISDRPEANPSRTTLKRINEFLLTPAAFVS